jgi:hypothetical protein
MNKCKERGLAYHRFQEVKSKIKFSNLLKKVFSIEFINNNILNHTVYSIVKKEDLKSKKVIKFSENHKCKCKNNKKEKYLNKKECKGTCKKAKEKANTEE